MRSARSRRDGWMWIGALLAVGITAGIPAATQQTGLAGAVTAAVSTAGRPRATPDLPFPTAKPDSAASASPKQPSVAALIRKASGGRLVPVIVGFDAAFVPEGLLPPAGVTAQRQRLADAGDAILAQLLRGSASGVKRFATIPYFAAQVDTDALQTLGGLPHVTSIVEDVPEPPLLGDSTTIVQADQVWSGGPWGTGITGTGWNVTVLDTGVDKNHEMFAGGKVIAEACYSTTGGGSTSVCPGGANSTAAGSGVNCPLSFGDGCTHGTHVAGIAAGNASGLKGVAPGAGVIAIQVFSAFGASSCTGGSPCVLAWTSDQILGLERVLALSGSRHIASVNLSLGGHTKYTSDAACDADNGARKAAIDHLRSVNIATVVASGNDGYLDGVSAPACISTAVAVGSTTKAGAVSSFSNLAPGMVELLAPGSSIRSSVPGYAYASWTGTSMAAPHVAGAWALLKAVAALKGNAGSVPTLQAALQHTGQPIVHAGSGGTYREIRVHDAAVQIDAGGGELMSGAAPIVIAGASQPRFMGARAALPAQETGAQWEATIEMNPEQVRLAQDNTLEMVGALQIQGVRASINNTQLELAGGQGIEQLRRALFDGAATWADFLGGPVELTLALPARSAPVTLQIEARATTGYRWDVLPADDQSRYSQRGESTLVRRYRARGAPSIQTIWLQADSTGDAVVRLRYRRSFEPDTPTHARLSIRMAAASDMIELSDPTPAEPAATRATWVGTEPSPYADVPPQALPASWDWRTSGIVPAVRNQGGCGSCWAFGTVGIMESAIKKSGGPLTDLSEQFLVSCNRDSWNCGDGGWTAHKYHYDTLGKNQTTVGAVLESVKPYTATDGTCTVDLSHPYQLSAWQFITPNEWTMPTVDQIKSAIYTYGPVTAGVCTDSGWNSYSGGVYVPGSNQCGGGTDHQIILVGWDDATSSWILRNSWGSGWGESGYMRIRWDTTGTKSRVGEGTSWVSYQGATSTSPTITDPANQTVTVGGTATFSVTVGGTPTPTVQWQVSTDGGTTWTDLANTTWDSGATTHTLTLTNTTLALNGNRYRARATNSVSTATSNSATLLVVSTTPTSLTASVSGSTLTLSWMAPTSGGAPTSYIIDVGSGPGLTDLAVIPTGSTATTFAQSGVGNGLYYVRVRATSTTSTSGPSNEVEVRVGPAPPGAPSGLTASVSGSNIALGWTASPTGGTPTAYTIEAGSGSGLANLGSFSTGNTATTFALGGVSDGIYYVRVRATNDVGASGPSNEAIAAVGCTSAPGAPSGLTITQNSGGNVAFAWTAALGGPTTYFLEAGSAPGLTDLANSDLGGTGTTFASSGVGGGTYYVRVKAGNACGKSGASNEVVPIVQ